MKGIFLTALTVVSFAIQSTAQDNVAPYNPTEIAIGMTFTDVVAVWGDPQIVEQEICNNRITNYWFMENGWAVIFCDGEVVNLCPGWSAQ